MLSFEALLQELPNCQIGPSALVPSPSSEFGIVRDKLPEFVGPNLSPREDVDQPESSGVMIVSAAGAVGKSTLARHVASTKGAPLWDLSTTKAVGANSATGAIASSFGFEKTPEVHRRLKSGELFLVIDALDEARLKANEAGFDAFIQNIAELAKDCSSPAIMLLGRTQTAETTWLQLLDVGVNARFLSIQPFTREQAIEYIDKRIAAIDSSIDSTSKDHTSPRARARDKIFEHLETAVDESSGESNSSTEEFLGYAPVLETIAVLLQREANYAELESKLSTQQGGSTTDRPLEVLRHVVTRVMDREREEKLLKNIKPYLLPTATKLKWSDWDSLYTRDEQIERLVAHVLKKPYSSHAGLPGEIRSKYEEQIEAWLQDHPFLRDGSQIVNNVFESYLFAYCLLQPTKDFGSAVETATRSPAYKPSRLLADFYLQQSGENGIPLVPDNHVGILYDALLAGESENLRVGLSIDLGDPEDSPDGAESAEDGEFELVYQGGEAGRPDIRAFRIKRQSNRIEFLRQIKQATVMSDGCVSLGGLLDDYEIGPSVHIRCKELEILSKNIIVRQDATASKDESGVALEALECESLVTARPVVRSKLSVSWPGSEGFPWNDYSSEYSASDIDSDLMHEVLRRFRRIATCFRSHSKGSLARFKDKVESRRMLQNDRGRMLLDRLVQDGVISLEGKFYHWHPDKSNEIFGVSWDDIRHRRMSDQLVDYLRTFAADTE